MPDSTNKTPVQLLIVAEAMREKFPIMQGTDGCEYVCIPPTIWSNIKNQVSDLMIHQSQLKIER